MRPAVGRAKAIAAEIASPGHAGAVPPQQGLREVIRRELADQAEPV
jgi:hypothetical protein